MSALACVCLSVLATPRRSGAATSDPPAEVSELPSVVRSHSGRFYVIAQDDMLKLVLLRWAEEVAERLERLVGFAFEFDSLIIRIVVNDNPASGDGLLRLSRIIVETRVIDQLLIDNYDKLEREDADESLCRLLLGAYPLRRPDPPPGAAGVPLWLSWGLAQNLYPWMRARNSREAFGQWQSGRLPTAAGLLRRDAADMKGEKAACGLFAAWLLSMPERDARFTRILQQTAEKGNVAPAWLAAGLPGCGSVVDMEEQWDRWIFKQRRIVYRPGEVFPEHVAQLKAALLLYPDVSAMRLEGQGERPLAPRDLIALRGKASLSGVLRSHVQCLKVLTIGRGDAFSAVVDAYGRFFEAVPVTRRERSLVKLLQLAETALEDLERDANARQTDVKAGEEPNGQGDR